MSNDEKVVSILKQQHRTLDDAVHALAKETANIKDIALRNQEDITVIKAQITVMKHEMNERFNKVDERFDKVDERFSKVNERFDQLELLIRQYFRKN